MVQDQVLQRSYAVEPIVALAASLDGVHCAGGGPSGTVYLWEVPSGRLLRSWPAHFKVSWPSSHAKQVMMALIYIASICFLQKAPLIPCSAITLGLCQGHKHC